MNEGNGGHFPHYLRPVVQLLADAKTNREIADAMTVSRHTAEKYVSELYRIFGARDRVQLVDMCRFYGTWFP